MTIAKDIAKRTNREPANDKIKRNWDTISNEDWNSITGDEWESMPKEEYYGAILLNCIQK